MAKMDELSELSVPSSGRVFFALSAIAVPGPRLFVGKHENFSLSYIVYLITR